MEILSWILGITAFAIVVFGFVPILVGTKLMRKYQNREGAVTAKLDAKGKIIQSLMPIGIVLIVLLMPVLVITSFILFFVVLF